jgi:hypothetical protein
VFVIVSGPPSRVERPPAKQTIKASRRLPGCNLPDVQLVSLVPPVLPESDNRRIVVEPNHLASLLSDNLTEIKMARAEIKNPVSRKPFCQTIVVDDRAELHDRTARLPQSRLASHCHDLNLGVVLKHDQRVYAAAGL